MRLREHTKIKYKGRSSWPPSWAGSYGPGSTLAIGEQGELKKVTKLEAHGSLPDHLVLEIEHEGGRFSGGLLVDDNSLLDPLLEILSQCIGSSIQEIGDREISLSDSIS